MGKIKKKPVKESNPDIDLKSLIHQHSLFFDNLIELIPARFYLPTDDSEKPWFQGLSKDAKVSAKKESRENVKKSRRDRLDPEKSSRTTLDLLMQNLEKGKSNDESDDEEEVEINPMMSGLENGSQSVTYEQLRERLRRKIEELRGGRSIDSSEKAKTQKIKKKEIQQKKRKREPGSEEKKPAMGISLEKVEKDAEEATKELKFSHVKMGDDEEEHGKKKRRKLSKLKELEKAKELEEVKKDPAISNKHSWKAATSRAAGIKVHDQSKLLKQSIQKEKKMRQKNSEKWKQRLETQQKMREEKQEKRSKNISERIQQKKMRRIEKREKKLMRPGFEGRQESYFNEPSS